MQITLLIPVLVLGVGLYLLFRLKFFFILHPIKTLRAFISAVREREARRSLFLALAGTLGVGNIFGVAAGIMLGGEGAVFWLFISSLFSMVIKYSETLLVFDTPECKRGMSGALSVVFLRLGRFISPIYALLTLLLSLFMGAALQARALSDTALHSLGISPVQSSLFLVALLLPCILGGGGKIEKITEIIIPLTTIIYIIMSFSVIFARISEIPDLILRIVRSAFSPRAVLGGGVTGGFLIALKEGFARGILSNEAGAGTSALAHSRSEGREPSVAGLFGMCEVFFDTTLLCMLTAFVVLLSGENISAHHSAMSLVLSSFTGTLGSFSGYILLGLVLLFAYSTVICWYFYGSECVLWYFPRAEWLFAPFFVLFLLFSHALPEALLISATDIILLLMSVFTLSAILRRSERIALLSLGLCHPHALPKDNHNA